MAATAPNPQKVEGSTQRLRVRLFLAGERAVRFGGGWRCGVRLRFATVPARENV